MTDNVPVCGIYSTSKITSDENTVKNLLEKELFSNQKLTAADNNKSKKTVWEINNKYYSCKVVLSVFDSTFENIEKTDQIEAILIYSDKLFDYKDLEDPKLKIFLSHFADCDTKLLVTKECTTKDKIRSKIMNWCLSHEFELIDFSENSQENEEEEEENIIFSATGQKRVIEALQTCSWSNMEMNKKELDPAEQSGKNESKNDDLMQSIDKELSNGDFEQLFATFANLKSKCDNLNADERKKYAEDVALSFWDALGGDEEDDSDT